MTRAWINRMLVLVVSLAGLVACSSGGGIGGTGITGVKVGSITGFGSIVVNDTRVDISAATVSLEGVPGDPGDPNFGLKLGMVVVVRGSFSADGLTGVAASVEFDDNLEGPVESVDVNLGQLTVLGHIVAVNASTVFDGFSAVADLTPGNMVEVSGFLVNPGETIVATRIELTGVSFDDVGELEVKGTISNLDPMATTFNLGSLLVDYSSAELEDVPGGGLTDGLFVAVKSTQPPLGGNTILASEVAVTDSLSESLGEEGDDVEVEGFVTEHVPPDQFTVNGVPVRTTAATEFENGASGDVTNGVFLEVEGRLNADGVLVAATVEFEDGEGEDGGDP